MPRTSRPGRRISLKESRAKADSDEARGLAPFDDLLQNPQPLRLHRAHADSRHEPHPLVLGVAVDDLNAVVRRRVMEGSAGVVGEEGEEPFPPRVIEMREESFAERLQLFDADCANGSDNGFAPGFRDFLQND